MRIIAGESKGRKLKIPEGIRPTQDKVRESIFNVLADKVLDATILDLFAGSGSFGFEALSRGADEVTFVETNPMVINVLTENINMLGYKEKTRVIRADAIKTLQNLESDSQRPDIVFADPPYNMKGDTGVVRKALQALLAPNIVAPEGTVVIELASEQDLTGVPGWGLVKERSYGGSCLQFLRKG